ncbi:hypothetical protein FEM48_Zijuj06G0002400 [Ziziphus jujuba var. spinosa]|uniref:Protein PIN-LIKES 3-like n=1 Tax=Ziziphus jujuba var. spinosa TaxID=714518 RepID=A0A978V624_ZIZJJ|nr:hypothetical protein FEM48_Zijuj06G0002400 [Ziziphus jujuba var. spinosa]
MELFRLFITASIPVLKVLLVTALGSYLALDRVNILGAETRKHLNTIVFYVFNPALVSSNLAKTITYDSMVKLWFMPVNILITFIIGSILGWIVIQFTRPPTHLRGLILGCCAAGNLGNLLLIIIPAVCKEKGSPFGNSGACYTYGLAYASLSMAIGAIYLWSYVYNIVRISSRSSKDTRGKDFSISKSSRESSISDLGNRTEPLLSSKEFGVTEDDIDHYALPRTLSEGKAEVAVADHLGIKQRFAMLFKKLNLKSLFAPSTIGALVGFAIGIVPQIRKSLIGDEAPLRVIQDTASLLGEGAIPTLTLIIGGNLLKGLKGSGMQKSIILGIVLARYIALPLTGTITQLFGAGESECSVIMLWTYALASISLTFWSTFFMWLVV